MKEFLSQKNVPFEERNVSENEAYMNELQQMGYSALPVVKVDDEVVVGKRQNQLTELLTLRHFARDPHAK